MPSIALLASRMRREEKWIVAALQRRGVPWTRVDPRLFHRWLASSAPRWQLVLNREIAQTRALYAALALEAAGVRVVNRAAAAQTCGDKWRTAVALRAAGLPIPRTALALTPEAARSAADELGYPVVFKPLTSSWGRRVVLVGDPVAADAVLEYCAALPSPQAHVLCVQEPVEKPGRDIRVVVVGGRPLGAIYRQAPGWRTNVALGAEPAPCPLTPELATLATGAAAATGAELAGVDILEGPDGELYVLEVNAGVEFAAFARCCDVDVAEAVVDHLLAGPAQRRTLRSAS